MSSKNTESSNIPSKDQPAPQAVRTRGAGSARSIANLTKDTSNPKLAILKTVSILTSILLTSRAPKTFRRTRSRKTRNPRRWLLCSLP